MNLADWGEALGALVGVMREAKAWRLTARPGRVVVDHAEGARALELAWSAEQHGKAEEALWKVVADRRSPMGEPRWPIAEGIACSLAGDAIVLLRGPDTNRKVEDLARDGVLSSLAARLLDAAAATGRNIIVAGPWLPSVELISAVIGGAQRPAVLGGESLPLPQSWVRVAAVGEAVTYGAERLACWGHDVDALAQLMATSSGVVGWLDARRLDRVLVRYEAAIDLRSPRAQAPLQVVAGVDLVVVLQAGAARVREIAEITMAADGYRPQLLFSTGFPPSPLALVPLAAPSFIDELAASGFSVLADELRAVVPRVSPEPEDHVRTVSRARAIATQLDEVEEIAPEAPRRQSGAGRDPLGIREALRSPQRGPESRPDPAVPEIPRAVVEALRHAPPPGWELDRAGGEEWVDDNAAGGNAEDAVMAATFGLAPPPRPAGYKGEAVSFAELLKKARDRDPQVENDSDLPPPPPDES
jgi:hypothetical protein